MIRAVLKDPKDYTELRLLYANSSPGDVLLKQELEEFAAEHDNFSVWFTGTLVIAVVESCTLAMNVRMQAAAVAASCHPPICRVFSLTTSC